mmetsp:Transcript_10195/g.32315  ORF Transcript_10195/g.32315 Transcript_10195/m.32315 type:complete len:272 (-) Transcript_10195:2732-3547(-)
MIIPIHTPTRPHIHMHMHMLILTRPTHHGRPSLTCRKRTSPPAARPCSATLDTRPPRPPQIARRTVANLPATLQHRQRLLRHFAPSLAPKRTRLTVPSTLRLARAATAPAARACTLVHSSPGPSSSPASFPLTAPAAPPTATLARPTTPAPVAPAGRRAVRRVPATGSTPLRASATFTTFTLTCMLSFPGTLKLKSCTCATTSLITCWATSLPSFTIRRARPRPSFASPAATLTVAPSSPSTRTSSTFTRLPVASTRLAPARAAATATFST